MKHRIQITETLQRTVEVEADSKEVALYLVTEDYNNEGIVLDYEDYNDVEITIVQ